MAARRSTMPLSDFQVELLRLLAANRSVQSYVAGATVLHANDRTPRYSQDLDIFHDAERSVRQSAEQDARTLLQHGYRVDWQEQRPAYHHAHVTREDRSIRLEWAMDSAVRFFPLEPDPLFGCRLHFADAATNKVLAAASRPEARDFVDLVDLTETYLSLGALCWAACGKDPGFTPPLLLNELARHGRHTQQVIDELVLRAPLDVKLLKRKWLIAAEDARSLVESLPPGELGCLYLDGSGKPVAPPLDTQARTNLRRHYPSVGGAWPRAIER